MYGQQKLQDIQKTQMGNDIMDMKREQQLRIKLKYQGHFKKGNQRISISNLQLCDTFLQKIKFEIRYRRSYCNKDKECQYRAFWRPKRTSTRNFEISDFQNQNIIYLLQEKKKAIIISKLQQQKTFLQVSNWYEFNILLLFLENHQKFLFQ
ncbi:unnamed protein product [Paramecium pentaurelia]|uniref:Uncharacterized protein n=1 Tax=Paramecium pentaurelia TaxID=43138 RepID=A0A8S1WWP1_9CILI|nr:unnamed protein product [Paramecium pentaurelia]